MKIDDLNLFGIVNTIPKSNSRPICKRCGLELVYATITAGDVQFSVFMCDCLPQPEGVKQDIVLAREWDHQALFYTLEHISSGDDDDWDEDEEL